MTLHVFAQHHERAMLEEVPELPWLRKVYNRGLGLAELQTDRLADGRLIMSDFEHPHGAAYVGLLNGRSHRKYARTGFSWADLPARLVDRIGPDVVLAPWTTNVGPCPTQNWLEFSEQMHPGMTPLVLELCRLVGISVWPKRVSLWANDFLCPRGVWDDWRWHWRRAFRAMLDVYGWNPPFADSNIDAARKPAYLMERITTAYFAARQDLTILQY